MILFLAFSCKEHKSIVEKPNDLVSKEQFIEVMTDIQLLEATYTQKIYDNDSIKFVIGKLYDETLEKHGMNEQVFQSNYNYYSSDSDLLDEIYNEVLANIDQLEQQTRRDQRKREN